MSNMDIESVEEKTTEEIISIESSANEAETIVAEEVAEVVEDDAAIRLNEWEAKFNEKSSELAIREAELKTREAQVEAREKVVEQGEKKNNSKEKELIERETQVKARENEVKTKEQNLELVLKQNELKAKAKLEGELSAERVKAIDELKAELEKKRLEFEGALHVSEEKSKQALLTWSNETKGNATKEAEKIVADARTVAETIIREASEKVDEDVKERTKEVSEREEKLGRDQQALNEKEERLNAQEEELEKRESELEISRSRNARELRRLKNKEEELSQQEEDIKGLVSEAISEEKKNYEVQLAAKDEALRALRDKVKEFVADKEEIEKFKVSIGREPAIIENEILNLRKTIDELKEELATRAPGEIQKERDDLRKDFEAKKLEYAELEKENKALKKKNEELTRYETTNLVLQSKNEELTSLVGELTSQNETYKQRIERLCSTEARLSDRDERIAVINKGLPMKLFGANMPMELSEVAWLNNIYKQCDKFGIHFPQRILYAFHTALKIADWSSVTVLAGVSGTGKSELPKLYAAFGGLNFINVPVQPSWDSQESMLGFFNSIDNRFEPEPLLRYLVQCTENEDYNKYMSIVLLDEMNLAHVEHYFADFLSKLETRRGASKSSVPTVEVKLGAGVEPYQLKLERSVLWTGTMNQDETTKSLSDKVLDRGLVINFPRPRELKSRKTMGILDKAVESTNRPMLTRSKWGSWIVREVSLTGEQEKELNNYKSIVEEINNELEHVGRALGHRVWQSIEYYIINYPTVVEEMHKVAPGEMSTALSEAMKIAFEDQIVQKIMPKLRGVETRGKSKEYLEKIETLLEDKGFYNLKDDFETACRQGYGQFIWSSAKYIEEDEAARKLLEKPADTSEE